MVQKYIIGVVVLAFLLTGCRSNSAAKHVAELRKARKAGAARELALAELEKNAENMALWRELAATDVALSEPSRESKNDEPFRRLIEAALICDAVYERDPSELEEKWNTVAAHVAQQAVTLANHALNNVVVHTERGRAHLGRTFTGVEGERYVDEEDMEWTVLRTVPLIFFARHLGPVISKDFASSVDDLEKRIAMMGVNTNIGSQAVEQRVELANTRTNKALEVAIEDLDDDGSFDFETIVNNGIFE